MRGLRTGMQHKWGDIDSEDSKSFKLITIYCLKFICSEKATKFCEIFTFLLTGTKLDKSKVNISQNFVAFSEYMSFNYIILVEGNE